MCASGYTSSQGKCVVLFEWLSCFRMYSNGFPVPKSSGTVPRCFDVAPLKWLREILIGKDLVFCTEELKGTLLGNDLVFVCI